jgi:hypothetical protein
MRVRALFRRPSDAGEQQLERRDRCCNCDSDMPSETRVSNVKKQEHKFGSYDDEAECRQETLANVQVEVERQCQ